MPRDLRLNEQIRAREVRVIGADGEQLGVVTLAEALRQAALRNLDLVEVAPTAVPPVCRVLDYGRFRYEQTKKEREARKHQKAVLVKEIRLRPKIDDHDIDFKTKTAEKFLGQGDKVKFTIIFRGRELAHPQLGRELLERVLRALKDLAHIEKPPSMEGRSMTLIVAPAVHKQARETKKAEG